MWRLLARSPHVWQRLGGTVVVTAVGMFGAGRGWGQSLATYPLSIAIGAISPAPTLHHDDVLDNREHLCLTVTLDHEVVDGAEAARFLAFLRVLIEEGHGLLRLVGLQRADQMQFDLGEFLLERRPFGLCLLHTVLAEDALAGLNDGTYRFFAEGLGDGDEHDGTRLALRLLLGAGDFLPDVVKPRHRLLHGKIPLRCGFRPMARVDAPGKAW
jgi:hypothetical protein